MIFKHEEITIQTKYAKRAPAHQSIRNWDKQFMGTLLHIPRSGRPRTSEEGIKRIRQSFSLSPTKFIRTASVQLQVPRSTIHKVLHKNLRAINFLSLAPSGSIGVASKTGCLKEAIFPRYLLFKSQSHLRQPRIAHYLDLN